MEIIILQIIKYYRQRLFKTQKHNLYFSPPLDPETIAPSITHNYCVCIELSWPEYQHKELSSITTATLSRDSDSSCAPREPPLIDTTLSIPLHARYHLPGPNPYVWIHVDQPSLYVVPLASLNQSENLIDQTSTACQFTQIWREFSVLNCCDATSFTNSRCSNRATNEYLSADVSIKLPVASDSVEHRHFVTRMNNFSLILSTVLILSSMIYKQCKR